MSQGSKYRSGDLLKSLSPGNHEYVMVITTTGVSGSYGAWLWWLEDNVISHQEDWFLDAYYEFVSRVGE